MGTNLKNIVRFTGLVVGVPTALPHLLNVNGRAVTPRIGGANASGITATANATNVIVTREADGPAAVDVYVEYWHTLEAVVPQSTSLGTLTPLFFAAGGGGSGGEESFALLNFDWAGNVITSSKNIAGFTSGGTGIRDFTFTTPVAEPDGAIITGSVVPEVDDAQIQPPAQFFAEITGGGTGMRVTVYPTQSAIPPNAVDPTDDIVRVFIRIDVVG